MLAPSESNWQRFWRAFLSRRELPALLLLSLVLLFFDRSGAGFMQRSKLFFTDVAAPLLELSARSGEASDEFWRSAQNHFSLRERNDQLREQNEQLLEWRALALELQRRLVRYEDLLDVVALPEESFLTARALGESGGPFEQAAILQAGREHGVAYGHGVIDSQGLVGRIIGVGERTSRVLLLTDFNSRIPVQVEPGGARGIASGDNSDTLLLQYLPEDEKVKPGDRLVTSGDGGFLPAGLPVGVVVGFAEDVPLVEPFMRADRLEWVRILAQASLHDVPAADITARAPFARQDVAATARDEEGRLQ